MVMLQLLQCSRFYKEFSSLLIFHAYCSEAVIFNMCTAKSFITGISEMSYFHSHIHGISNCTLSNFTEKKYKRGPRDRKLKAEKSVICKLADV